jgi:hypothetical protein
LVIIPLQPLHVPVIVGSNQMAAKIGTGSAASDVEKARIQKAKQLLTMGCGHRA